MEKREDDWMNRCMTECRGSMRCISPGEQAAVNRLRVLWEQHVYWTRLFISGTVFDLPDVKVTENRLLRNPKDFAVFFKPIYGERAAAEFERLFTEHLTIAGTLVTELKAGDTAAAEKTERQWYENADELAVFLAGVNPCWSMEEWQEMMYSHLAMTKAEAAAFLSGAYEDSVEIFEAIEQEALEMADMMARGLGRGSAPGCFLSKL